MAETIHLVIQAGAEPGREITVPTQGLRVGRSSSNDLALPDRAMSRFHCRFYLKEDGSVWVNDLGASNPTTVNGAAVTDHKLEVDDILAVGDTTMKVVHNGLAGAPMSPPPPAEIMDHAEPPAPGAPLLDLGLNKKDSSAGTATQGTAAPEERKLLKPLLYLAVALLIFIVGATVTKSIALPSAYKS